MGEIYDSMKALAIAQKEKGQEKVTPRLGMMYFWDSILEEVYKTKGEKS